MTKQDSQPGTRQGWRDVFGVAWVIASGVLLLVPAIVHGGSLGDYDWLAQFGLVKHPVFGVNQFASDQITQMIPWTNLAWSQVHHGHLPLWNTYSVLGTPLAFNWQSAAFSLPALIGYLMPQDLAYTAQLVVTLVVAGTGAYFLSRVLRLGVLASIFAGVGFELCGTFFGWLGWPVAGVLSWIGWLLAFAVLIVRGRRRARSVVLFSVALALAVYAGQPDTLVLLGLFLAVFVLVLLVAAVRTWGAGAVLPRSVVDLGLAGLAGIGLSAPLLLPGLQLLAKSSRTATGAAFNSQSAVPLGHIGLVLFPGINGWPIPWSRTYVGVVAVVLALIGMLFNRKRPAVVAMVALTVAGAAVTFVPPVIEALNAVPGLKAVRFPRAFGFFEFGVAILAAVGLSSLTSVRRTVVLKLAAVGFAIAGIVPLFILFVAPTGDYLHVHGLLWAIGGSVVGLGSVALLVAADRRSSGFPAITPVTAADSPSGPRRMGGFGPPWRSRLWAGRWAAAIIVIFETAFLMASGTSAWTSTSTPFAPTPAARQFASVVGSSLVGLGSPCAPPNLGIPANANIAYGVDELWTYDPLLPTAYYTSWEEATGQSAGYPESSTYCPDVTSVALARRYGVSFILEHRGVPGPPGAVFDRSVADESIYRVPGAARATVTPLTAHGGLPGADAPDTRVAVSVSATGQWRLRVRTATPGVLRLRLTDSPGWTATIDGRPLKLSPFSGIMLQALVPAGSHVVKVAYWPRTFTLGIVCALLSALGLTVTAFVAAARRQKGERPSTTDPA